MSKGTSTKTQKEIAKGELLNCVMNCYLSNLKVAISENARFVFYSFRLNEHESTLMACCCKVICGGCHYANLMREAQGSLDSTCAFCRQPRPKSKEDFDMCLMRRVAANDPFALCQMGANRRNEEDYDGAFEYWAKAAALGDAAAHCGLSDMYRNGEGFEKDEKKALHHLEQAAIGGHPFARNNLGVLEERKGRIDRAVKHWIIAAKLGDDLSLESIKGCFTAGLISKDVFAEALRACQAAIDETKSPQREAAVQKLNAAGIAR